VLPFIISRSYTWEAGKLYPGIFGERLLAKGAEPGKAFPEPLFNTFFNPKFMAAVRGFVA
jgi:hypothetical protein